MALGLGGRDWGYELKAKRGYGVPGPDDYGREVCENGKKIDGE